MDFFRAVVRAVGGAEGRPLLQLRVIMSDLTDSEVFVQYTDGNFAELKKNYLSARGLAPERVRFMFRDHEIADTDTPAALGIVDNDMIVVLKTCAEECDCPERDDGGNLVEALSGTISGSRRNG